MAPIRLGKFSVEIAVNSIEGFIHELIDLPAKNGFWVNLTVVDREDGKMESFPLIDAHYRIQVYDSYSEALHDAAQRLIKKDGSQTSLKKL